MGEAIRSLLRTSSSRHRPRQLAAAIAMGVLCGLLPKLSMIFCLLGSICFLLPIHIPLAALVCVICSSITTALAPTAGNVGIWSLTNPLLRDFWLALDALPIVPWLGLHNSVVHGSLLIGLCLWIPVFIASRPMSRWLAPRQLTASVKSIDPDFANELKPSVAAPEQAARPLGAGPIEIELPERELPPLGLETDEAAERLVEIEMVDQAARENDICRELETLLGNCDSDRTSPMSVENIVERASQIAQYVDELLTASELDGPPVPRLPHRRIDDASEQATRAPQLVAAGTEANRHSSTLASVQVAEGNWHSRSGTVASLAEPRLQASHAQPASTAAPLTENRSGPTAVIDSRETQRVPTQLPADDARQQEALRYLLHHLKAFKDKV